MAPAIDPETGRQAKHKLTGRPLFRLDEQRELDLILRYRDRQRRDELAAEELDFEEVPF